MSQQKLPLSQLPTGQRAVVSDVQVCQQSLRNRLLDLGLLPGTRITALFQAPFGDPVAFLVKGAVVAIRRSTARQIRVYQPADNDPEEGGRFVHG